MQGQQRQRVRAQYQRPAAADLDRRSACRYSVVQENAWLGWWQGQAYRTTGARIIDISLRGAFLVVDHFPPPNTQTFFCPPGVESTDDWIEVKVVATRKKLFRPREMRVIFQKPFPYEVFKAVVYGPDTFVEPAPSVWVPYESNERDYW